MKYASSAALALLFAGTISALPPNRAMGKRADSGSYTVPGLGSRKQELTSAGAASLDMAIAMLETETMTTDYTYGDGKTEDAANFGIFKQNWGMLTECSSQFQGQTTADWNNGAVLNDDLNADIAARQECEAFYGQDKWFAGHRNGESGLQNPNTDDIQLYKDAIFWIQEQLESNGTGLTDDTRYWYDVPPI